MNRHRYTRHARLIVAFAVALLATLVGLVVPGAPASAAPTVASVAPRPGCPAPQFGVTYNDSTIPVKLGVSDSAVAPLGNPPNCLQVDYLVPPNRGYAIATGAAYIGRGYCTWVQDMDGRSLIFVGPVWVTTPNPAFNPTNTTFKLGTKWTYGSNGQPNGCRAT